MGPARSELEQLDTEEGNTAEAVAESAAADGESVPTPPLNQRCHSEIGHAGPS